MQFELFNKETNKLINCIREVEIDGKMALISLYDDLPHFEYDLTIENLEKANNKLKKFIQELQQQIGKLKNENSHFKSVNAVLSKNITSLYKTAANEIQRKDKIIDGLRKNQVYASQTSKMISSRNIFPLGEAQNKQICEIKNISEENIGAADQSEQLNEKNYDNFSNIVIQPNRDIPKTVYYKRLCQKLVKQNQITEIKKPLNIQNRSTISIDNIVQDENEEMNRDGNLLEENMTTSLIHNESKNNLNSTLVICESDVSPSDGELNTTPVIQCNENQVIGKQNVSFKQSFSKQKQPIKSKQKMVINPATIGVQNTLVEKFIPKDKLSKSKNLYPKIQHDINDLSKNKTKIKKNLKLTCDDEHGNKCNSKTIDHKLSTSDISHNEKSSPSNDDNQIPLKNVGDYLHTKVMDKMILQKDINSQLESMLPTNNHKSRKLNRSVESSSTSVEIETSMPTTNIEVEQLPFRRKRTIIKKYNDVQAFNEVKKLSPVACINPSINNEVNKTTKNTKCSSTINEIDFSSFPNQKTNLSKSKSLTIKQDSIKIIQLNDSDGKKFEIIPVEKSLAIKTNKPSINIEVEQFPIARKIKVIKKDNSTATSKMTNTSSETCARQSNNLEFNIPAENFKRSSTNNEIIARNPITQINNKRESKSPSIKQDSKFIKIIQLNDSDGKKFEIIPVEKSLAVKTNKPSINIEVEQFPIVRKIKVIKKDNSTATSKMTNTSSETCARPLNNLEFNIPSENFKRSSTNNEIKARKSITQINNKRESKSPPIKQDSSYIKNIQLNDSDGKKFGIIPVEKSLAVKTNKPSINIEVEQFPIVRKIKVIKKDNSTATNKMTKTCARQSNNIEFNIPAENFKRSSTNNEIKARNPITQINNKPESKSPSIKQDNICKLTESTKLNDSVDSFSKNTSVETSCGDEKSVPSINIEVEQGSIFRRSNTVKVLIHSIADDSNKETKKGRRVPLITIKDHCSQPLPSFNGAKKTEIDLSKKSIHTEKVVESSSHFYVPQVKRRRTMNFGNADS